MNKADEKQLKKDPRYAAVRDAHHRLRVAYAEAQRIQLEATVAFKQETGLEGTQIPTQAPLPDERLFELLRPRGDNARGVSGSGLGEIINVTEHRVMIGRDEYDLYSGHVRARYSSRRIHPEDLAKIKSGKLRGWRQKKWGEQ